MKWTKYETEELTKDYMNFVNSKEMEAKYKRNFESIQRKASNLGLNRGQPKEKFKVKLHKLNIEEVIKAYESGKSGREVGLEFSISSTTVTELLKSNNIYIRNNVECKLKYKQNNNYFEKIDTEGKAYFLGFLYADGCNFMDKYLKLSLKSNDLHIIESFKKEVESNRPIDFDKRGMVNFIISSEKMSKDLTRLGCISNKTFKLKFPTEDQVPEELIHHFIRGFFDGDGGIHISNDIPRMYFTTTLEFIESLSEKLEQLLNIKKTKIQNRKGNDTNIRTLSHGGKVKALLFKDFLYKDATFYLNRKYNKFKQYISPNI